MSQTSNGDFINLQDLVSLLDFSIPLRWSAWLDVHHKNAICRCAFAARDTQTF